MDDRVPVLVLDDDPIELRSLSEYLRLEGYSVSTAEGLQEAFDVLESDHFRVVMADIRLPEGSGFDLLRHVQENDLPTAVIMVTGYGTIEDAVRAIKMGAFDYVTKPISDDEVQLAIERALQQQQLLEENSRLRQQLNMTFQFGNFVCGDPKMKQVLDMAKIVAGNDATVLITGESGTGKTVVARAIHMNSARAGNPFVELGCGTLPDTLLESELFGHMKGAFSGAIADKRGRFDAANGGTLFLDEISLASPSLQQKLLRVLEDFKFEPVGSTQTREVDVRLILATNEDLGKLLANGDFREDLYYRVNVMNISLPPLRERRDDILPLARHFLEKYGPQARREIEGLSEESLRMLSAYDWPGNVRELENVIQRAVLVCDKPYITPEALEIRGAVQDDVLSPEDGVLPLREAMKRVERRLILAALKAADGNRKETARRLEINRTTLYNKLHEHDIMDA
ncbi:MAG: sigma-54 dependent transcriptional regulator [Candidatus Brocadiia bacterium]